MCDSRSESSGRRLLHGRHEGDPSGVTRRQFVQGGVAAATALAVGSSPLPTRAWARPQERTADIPTAVLGRTGEKVSLLGLGTACLGEKNGRKPDLEELIPVFAEAVDRGITYVDTARHYGRAEEALGHILKTRRDRVFLVTKAWADTAEAVHESFEKSLAELGVDHVDLFHLHSCGSRDVDRVLGERGAWGAMQKLKKEGKVRFVGLTGHSRPANFVRIIRETGEVDALMMAMNFADYHTYGFEEKVLPLAREKKIGVMAMKVYGGIRGGFRNYGAKTANPSQMERDLHDDAVRYARSLEGVTGMVIGVHSAEQMRENIRRVLEAKPFSAAELAAVRDRGKALAGTWGPRFGPVS